MTMQETAKQREAQIQVLNVFCKYWTNCFCFKTTGIRLKLVHGEGRLTYPVVDTKTTGSEEALDEANYGRYSFSKLESSLETNSVLTDVSSIMKNIFFLYHRVSIE